jgi:hypothetical protein
VQIQEISLAKPNYRHAKKQKESARKARQDAKQQRRAAATPTSGTDGAEPGPGAQDAVKPTEDVV